MAQSPDEPTAERVAEAFDRDQDPLKSFSGEFEELDVDPFEFFVREVVEERDVVDSTVEGYRRTYRHWKTFMSETDRHPACPAEDHVIDFIDHLRDARENHPNTVQQKIRRLNDTYQFWQQAPEFPQPADFNPVALAMSKVSFTATEDQKEYPAMSMSELRGVVRSVKHIRDRLVLLLQLKLGLRASELCNVKLADVDLRSSHLQAGYETLGTHRMLAGRPNAIYIPHDRDRNKSSRPRVLPLDEETQSLLESYLFARPDTGEPWLFLSKDTHNKLSHFDVNDIWAAAFRPMYDETEHSRAVGSHFGRHYFTSFWRVERELDRQSLRYMRGDRTEGESMLDRKGIDEYIHTYYEDIVDTYRDEIYRLGFTETGRT